MTWKEYYKENSDKIPKEFVDKEITVEDCLKIMDAMSFTIKELFDRKKWHTGTPTEEGWYLLECNIGNSEETYYTTDRWSNDCKYWTVDRVNRVVRWQKIEPYTLEQVTGK